MKTVCTFCGKVIRDGSSPDAPVSHGICPECYEKIHDRYGFNVKKFLDQLDSPALLVDANLRVLAANYLALALTGKTSPAVQGVVCGEVLDCINASRPRGCGNTEFCPDCTFRGSVNETYKTGKAVNHRAAILVTKNGGTLKEIPLWVSTRKDGNVVLLRLEPVNDE